LSGGFPFSAMLAIALALSSTGILKMVTQNLQRMKGAFKAEANGLDSLRGHRAQSDPVMLCEFKPDKCCRDVARSSLFPNPRQVCSLSISNIRLTSDFGCRARLIPWRKEAGKPIGTSLVRNRGTSCFSGLPAKAASADPAGRNVRPSVWPRKVVASMESKSSKEVEFRRISATQTSVRKNPQSARVKDRSWDSMLVVRSAESIGRESRYISGQWCSQMHGKVRHLRIPKRLLKILPEGAVWLAEVSEK
jgi:hypothetical protein